MTDRGKPPIVITVFVYLGRGENSVKVEPSQNCISIVGLWQKLCDYEHHIVNAKQRYQYHCRLGQPPVNRSKNICIHQTPERLFPQVMSNISHLI